jgi:phosphoglycolate phosphatase-like HAD superfamily hydrolase
MTVDDLKNLKPGKEFFVGIDSDGCVFDSMEVKHKECFCPAFVNVFELQAAAKYAREAWDFVNLYSQSRGCNRFHAVLSALDLLRARPEVQKRGVRIPELRSLREWVKRESKLGNPTLQKEIERTGDPELIQVMRWSKEVNENVEKIVRSVPPFPWFRECLDKLNEKADVIVVSQTPSEALMREWAELGIDKKVRFIAGQELGTKGEHLSYAAQGKYPAEKILMIGDAPGDYKAAQTVKGLFFPIVPGREDESWKRCLEEAIGRFFSMSYQGAYEKGLLAEFDKSLPSKAPWQSQAV